MSYDIFHLSYKAQYADETFKNLKYNDIPIQYLYHIDEFIDK